MLTMAYQESDPSGYAYPQYGSTHSLNSTYQPSSDKGTQTTPEIEEKQVNQTRKNLLSFNETAANLTYREHGEVSLPVMALTD